MVPWIDASYNAIFGRSLLNELNEVLSLKYLLMKFKTNKGITSVRGDQVEARRRCMILVRVFIKQPEVMMLESLEE